MQLSSWRRKAPLCLTICTIFAAALIASTVVVADRPASATTARLRAAVAGTASGPTIKSIRVAPSVVGGNGGTATIQAHLANSGTCHFVMMSHPLFKVTLPTQQACKTTVTSYIKLGANPTNLKRAVALDFVAAQGSRSSKVLLYIAIAPKPVTPVVPTTTSAPAATTTTTTTPPIVFPSGAFTPPPPPVSTPTTLSAVTTSTTPAITTPSTPATTTTSTPAITTTTTSPSTTSTTVPPVTTTTAPPAGPVMETSTSGNWSGYVLDGTGFTTVSGTLTVPYLETDATCDTFESQWVGIDGSTNSDLIQAGIEEVGTEDNPAYSNYGECGIDQVDPVFYTNAWYEILPSPEIPQTMPVMAGDTVSVSITLTGGQWYIDMNDVTNGQSWSTTVDYSGPETSGEWITEATTGSSCGGICTETAYTPAVTWSNLGYTSSSVSDVDAITMVQNDEAVSTPSPVSNLSQLISDGFTTTYTGED
jgi:hypothetical protein